MTKKGIIFTDSLGNTVLLQDIVPAQVGDRGALFENIAGQAVFIKAGASSVGDVGVVVPNTSGLPLFVRRGQPYSVVTNPCFINDGEGWTKILMGYQGFITVSYPTISPPVGMCSTALKYAVQTQAIKTGYSLYYLQQTIRNCRVGDKISFWYKGKAYKREWVPGHPEYYQLISLFCNSNDLFAGNYNVDVDWTKYEYVAGEGDQSLAIALVVDGAEWLIPWEVVYTEFYATTIEVTR